MEPLPLSLLNDYLFCKRRAALKILEGWWGENVHTLIGDLAHEHADLPGYEVAKGVTLLRALPVSSERLGWVALKARLLSEMDKCCDSLLVLFPG